ncbi:MAG: hypothetical protein RLZZ269_377 [Actinomycetota bacterium]
MPMKNRSIVAVVTLLSTLLSLGVAPVEVRASQPTCINKTTANGLGDDFLNGVYADGNTIYAATVGGGLSISTNSGTSFTNVTTSAGLGNNFVWGVYAVGNTIYAAIIGGLSISTDGGTSFTNVTTSAGLGSNVVTGVYAVGNTIYAATEGGLSVSTNSATTFINRTTSDGLGDNTVWGVYAVGNTIYAATIGGLSISTNSATSFTNVTTANGLGNNVVRGVYAVGNTIYAATAGGLSICTFPTVSSPAPPLTPIWRATLDPNGGTCTDGTARSEPWTSVSLGYRYLPGASECTRPGYTFTGWARSTAPTIPVDLPLLIDPSDGVPRYFVASNVDLIAIWTKNPEPKAPTTFVALNGFFCRNCGNWLIWNKADNATAVNVTSGNRTVCTSLKITIDQWTLCHDPQPPRGPITYTLTATNETTSSPPITATTPR